MDPNQEERRPRIPPGTPQIRTQTATPIDPETNLQIKNHVEATLTYIAQTLKDPTARATALNQVVAVFAQAQYSTAGQVPGGYIDTTPLEFNKDKKRKATHKDSDKNDEDGDGEGGDGDGDGDGSEHETDDTFDPNNPKESSESDKPNDSSESDNPDDPDEPGKGKEEKKKKKDKAKKAEKNKKSKPKQTEVLFTKMAAIVSADYDLEWMGEARTSFYKALRKIKLFRKLKKNEDGEIVEESDDPKSYVVFVNYFFTDMLGGARQRVINIVRDYQAGSTESLSQAVSIRAENLASNTDLPEEARRVFGSLANVIQLESARKESDYTALRKHMKFLTMFYAYQTLVGAITHGNEPVIRLLSKHKQLQQGVGAATVAKEYITKELGLEPNTSEHRKFSNYLNCARGLNWFVEGYGRGILALLPRSAYYKFTTTAFGIRRIETAIPILVEIIPWLRDLCHQLDDRILTKIQDGEPIDIQITGHKIGATVDALLQQEAEDQFDSVIIEEVEVGDGQQDSDKNDGGNDTEGVARMEKGKDMEEGGDGEEDEDMEEGEDGE